MTAPPSRPTPDDWPTLVFDDLDDSFSPTTEGSATVASARVEVPTLSAAIPPPPAPSLPAPVPPEPAAPLVASTLGEGAVVTELPRRRRRGVVAGISAAATIVVLAGAALILGSLSHGAAGHPPAVSSPQTLPPTTQPPPAPPKASAVLISSNSQGARYSVAPPAASIELVPSSRCWVQVRTGSANGPVVFQGIMLPGDHMPLPTTGAVWLRLGNPPAITIVVNGTPLHLATPSVAQPYNLEFQPAS